MECGILLTLKEAAYFENKTEKSIRVNILRNKMKAEKLDTGVRCGFEYRVPLTELSIKAQKRYFAENTLVDEDVHLLASERQKCEEIKRTSNFEELNSAQRDEARRWEKIIKAWDDYILEHTDKKTILTEKFVDEYNHNHDKKISVRNLYEKNRLYRQYGVAGLSDARMCRKSRGSRMDERLYAAFTQWYLNENRLSVSYIYENLKRWVEQEELDIKVPSESSFRRAVESIPVAVIKCLRHGKKEYQDECEPYVRRMYSNIESNEYWSSDYHTLDFMVRDDITGEIYRPHICTWIDIRSRKVLSVRMRKTADSHGVILAFKDAVEKYGIPFYVYLDNGREFLVHDFGGRGKRKTDENADYGTNILERLGIKMTNAKAGNGKAKVIERSYKQVTSEFSKLYITYCGNRPGNRPYSHKDIMKKEENIPLASEVKKELENYLFGLYNNKNSDAEGLFGDTPNEAYAKNLIKKKVLTEDQLNLMLLRNMRLQKVDRNGVYIKVGQGKVWYYDAQFVSQYLGRKVYVRYDPDKLESVRVYDSNEAFMTVLDKMPEGGYDAANNIEAIKYVNASKKKLSSYVKNFVANQKKIMEVKPLKDIVMRAAEEQRRRDTEEDSAVVFVDFSFKENKVEDFSKRINFETMIKTAGEKRG